ncbi:hypothetical protein LY76DRAFT_677338 [Colletotrichum caudatum]|nr:hypothetical protein LY76DRAFT_677338 [Colletotrichum caudatum]
MPDRDAYITLESTREPRNSREFLQRTRPRTLQITHAHAAYLTSRICQLNPETRTRIDQAPNAAQIGGATEPERRDTRRLPSPSSGAGMGFQDDVRHLPAELLRGIRRPCLKVAEDQARLLAAAVEPLDGVEAFRQGEFLRDAASARAAILEDQYGWSDEE